MARQNKLRLHTTWEQLQEVRKANKIERLKQTQTGQTLLHRLVYMRSAE